MVQLLVASTCVCPDNVAPLHTIAVLSTVLPVCSELNMHVLVLE